MAFVFRSSREIKLNPNEIIEPGPGQYIQQDLIKINSPNKAPFNISSPKDYTIKKDDQPGPGSYQYDEKYEKMIEKQKNEKIHPIYKSIESNLNLGDAYINYIENKNKPTGFMTKDRRFKENVQKTEVPGPGSYSIEKSYIKDNTKGLTSRPKRLIKLSEVSQTKIASIPSKLNSYGYDTNQNGQIVLNEDPDKSIKYFGEKNDSVGPGIYDIIKPSDWIKRSLDWSKEPVKKENKLEKIESISTMAVSHDSNDANSIFSKYNQSVIKSKIQQNKAKILKQTKERRSNLLNMQQTKKESDLIDKMIYDENPGPGYYYQDEGSYIKTVMDKFQTFGSSSPRFNFNIDYSDLGPGRYFNDDSKFEKFKQQNQQKISFKIKPYDYLSRQRSVEGAKIEKEIKEEISRVIGPGYYQPNLSIRENSPSNISHFGSLQKRFIERKYEKEKSPGPGAYLQQNKWGSLETSEINKLLKERIRPKKIYKLNSLIKNDNPYSNTIVEEIDEIPAVGTYNPDAIFSIGYKVSKVIKTGKNNKIAPFFSQEKRFKEIKDEKLTDQLGPGFYFKERKKIPERNSPPFNIGDRRFRTKNLENHIGPSEYNQHSYFDWNKKSYNILYL
jgi:hypothetical protein